MFGIDSYLSRPMEMQRHILNKPKYLRIAPNQMIILGEGNGVNSTVCKLRGVLGAFLAEQQHLCIVF